MPIFRFDKVFGLARGVRIFLNLEGGLTRGTPLDNGAHRGRAAKLENARRIVREQKKNLKDKDREIRQQASDLKAARKLNHRNRRKLRQQEVEIFQLKNELRMSNDLAKVNREISPSSPASETLEEPGRLPDFVVIGAQRGGTTQFYRLLTQHPEIEPAAIKETHYFDRPENFSKGIEWYRRCFPSSEKDGRRSITGEATPAYLIDPLVPERMAKVTPKARLIVLLRDPVIRAYSQYHMAARNGDETRSFEEAVDEELSWLLDEGNGLPDHELYSHANRQRLPDYLRRGIYVDHFSRWRRCFDEEQILVLKSEDFFERPQETSKLAQDFLGLPFRELKLKVHKTKHSNQPMESTARRQAEDFFKPHNGRLYEYLGRDLDW